MVKSLGWFGSVLLALCGAPAAFDVIQKGTATGYSTLFILMWGLGEILTFIYVYIKHGWEYPLLFNYGLNIIFISIITFYLTFA